MPRFHDGTLRFDSGDHNAGLSYNVKQDQILNLDHFVIIAPCSQASPLPLDPPAAGSLL